MTSQEIWAMAIAFSVGAIMTLSFRAIMHHLTKDEEPEVEEDEPEASGHPYRDGAPPNDDEDDDEEEDALEPVYAYRNYDTKIWLRCPHCDGGVTEFQTCTCDGVDLTNSDNERHFHVTCPHCSTRFAMETIATYRKRMREKKQAEAPAAEKSKAN